MIVTHSPQQALARTKITEVDMNKDEMIRDLIYAIEVLRDRLPDDEDQMSKHEIQAVIIHEDAIRILTEEIFKKEAA